MDLIDFDGPAKPGDYWRRGDTCPDGLVGKKFYLDLFEEASWVEDARGTGTVINGPIFPTTGGEAYYAFARDGNGGRYHWAARSELIGPLTLRDDESEVTS